MEPIYDYKGLHVILLGHSIFGYTILRNVDTHREFQVYDWHSTTHDQVGAIDYDPKPIVTYY